jgi:quinol monooxygenase YgiN
VSETYILNFHASAGNADALLALLQQGRDFSLESDGCEAFEVYQRVDDPHHIVFVERWASVAEHDANFATKVKGSGHLDKIIPLLSEPISGHLHRAV